MHHFDELSEVQSAVQRLISREPPLVKVLARQPGTKESRYMHLLSGDAETATAPEIRENPGVRKTVEIVGGDSAQKFSRLEAEVAELREAVADLKQQLAAFRKQFD
jgi:uncharacterized protein YceH (UPF0502 family)